MESSSSMAGPGQPEILRHRTWSLKDINSVALIISLPDLATQFGYGYAILAQVSIPAATTIELFAGSTSVGSIPFAGVASDTPFDRTVLTFSDVVDAFAVDNVTFAKTVSDEGRTLILLSVGIFVLFSLRVSHRVQFRYRQQ